MGQTVISGLALTTGLLAVGVGVVAGRHSLRDVRRLYRRTSGLGSAVEAGWRGWFFSGFSGVTMGVQWLVAASLWMAWTLAGVSLVALGLRLFNR